MQRYCEDSLRCLKHDTNMVLQNSQHYVSALKSLEEATTLAQQTGNNSMTVVLLGRQKDSCDQTSACISITQDIC